MRTFAQKPQAPQQATRERSARAGGATRGAAANHDGSAADRVGHDFSRIPIHVQAPIKIQAKLAIQPSGDAHEAEADRVSEQVMQTSERRRKPPCACGGGCKKCRAKPANSEAFGVRTKRVPAGAMGPTAAPGVVRDALAGPGQPLDASTRAFMEPRFGYSFSRIRVHNDAQAAASAQSINALAYTSGTDVVFAAGQYAPATAQGRKLLAHELTHVLQQGGGASGLSRAPSGSVQRKDASGPPAAQAQANPNARGTCDADQTRKIRPAATKAALWLARAVPALEAFLSGGKSKEAQAAGAAFTKHFHSTEPAVVGYVRDRLKSIQSDVNNLGNFRSNCPPAGPPECPADRVAFVPLATHDEINFCPLFFERNEDDCASTIIHEFGHAQAGLSQKQLIIDREYKHQAYYAYMTTGEALTSADSYALFVREAATGSSPAQGLIVDHLRKCPDAWVPIVRDALAMARAWNHKAAMNTGHRDPFSLAYKRLDVKFESADDYKCIPDGGGRCSEHVAAYWYAAGDLRICPILIAQRTPEDRALSLLSALYAYKDLVDGKKSETAAREAMRLHTANVPATADVLSGK